MTYGMRPDRYFAAICRTGHMVKASVTRPDQRMAAYVSEGRLVEAPVEAYCGDCGSEVLFACEKCRQPLLGDYRSGYGASEPEEFCRGCGSSYPWTSREARVRHLEGLLGKETQLDDFQRLEALGALHALVETEQGPVTPKQEKAAASLRKLASQAWWNVANPVLVAIVSSEVKTRLGLPPGP